MQFKYSALLFFVCTFAVVASIPLGSVLDGVGGIVGEIENTLEVLLDELRDRR
jgi:hypothetical protein